MISDRELHKIEHVSSLLDPVAQDVVKGLVEEIHRLRKGLERIRDEDYRGSRPSSVYIALEILGPDEGTIHRENTPVSKTETIHVWKQRARATLDEVDLIAPHSKDVAKAITTVRNHINAL